LKRSHRKQPRQSFQKNGKSREMSVIKGSGQKKNDLFLSLREKRFLKGRGALRTFRKGEHKEPPSTNSLRQGLSRVKLREPLERKKGKWRERHGGPSERRSPRGQKIHGVSFGNPPRAESSQKRGKELNHKGDHHLWREETPGKKKSGKGKT